MANPALRSEFEQRVSDGIAAGLKQAGGSPGFLRDRDQDSRDGGGRGRSRDHSDRYDRYDNRDRSRGRDQNHEPRRGDRSHSRGRDSYRRTDDYNRGERRNVNRSRDNSRDRGRDDRNREEMPVVIATMVEKIVIQAGMSVIVMIAIEM